MGAGTIDSLNFEVLVNDKQFDAKIKSDLALAQKFNTQLSKVLDFRGKVRDTNQQLTGTSSALRTISQLTGVAFSVEGVRRFLSSMIEITGQFEVQKMALRNMVQDIDKADKIFEDLYNFSSKSTYRFSELAKYAKQLAAFSIDSDKLLDTTKRLGDVASGIGVSMDRIILAYGHVKSSGFLRGIQLRSFAQNGVPVLEELAKMLTEVEGRAVSLGDVFDKMLKREITFEMVEEAFKRMTSEGGKFYKMQEVLAKTLAGQINILKGKWENLKYAIGESQEGILKGAVAALTKIVSSTESFGRAITTAIAVLGTWKVASLATGLATGVLTDSQNKLVMSLGGIVKFVARNPYVLLATSVASLIVVLVRANGYLTDTQKITKALSDTTDKYNVSLANEMRELDVLVGRMKSAREGTDEYAAAKLALERRFDPYIQQLKAEGVAVNDLALLYEGLAKKITEANKQKFLERAQESISDAYGTATDNIEKDTQALIEKIGGSLGRMLTGDEEGALRHYIQTGEHNAIMKALEPELKKDRYYTNNSPFATGYRAGMKEETYMDRLRNLMNRNTSAVDAYSDAMVEAAKRFDAANDLVKNNEDTSTVTRLSDIVKEIKNYDADIEKLRKKAAGEGITSAEKEQLDLLVSFREEEAKRYREIMGVDYDKYVKSSQTEQDKAVNERIKNLKAEISILEKYRDAREKLEPYFGDDTNRQLTALFGERDYDAVDDDIQALIRDLRALGEEGVQAAEQIETRLGMDALGLVLKQQKAIEKYNRTLADWTGKDYTTSGTGDEYKIGRIFAKYNEDVAAVQKKFNEAVKQAAEAHKGNTTAIDAEIEKLKQLRSEELAFIAAERDESLAQIVSKKLYKEATKEFDLNDWAHKSVGQLIEIREKLKSIEVPAWVHQTYEHNQPGFEKFLEALKLLADADISKAGEVITEKRMRNFQKYAQIASSLADSLIRIGEASGDGTMKEIGESLSFIADTASSVFERLANGDVPGAILAGITSVINGIVEAIAEAIEFERKIRELREEARRAGFTDMLGKGVDSVFGENAMAKVNNAVSVMKELREAMSARGGDRKFELDNTGFLGITHWAPRTLEKMAKSIGRDLYDVYGNFNAETLQAILDTYDNLKQSEKEWIQQAINDSQMYAEAMEQIESVMESLFGDISSQAADKIVDSWIQAGDAALDYADILNDVAVAYAKMITQSMLIDSVMTDDFKKALSSKFSIGDTEGAMELIMQGMDAMQALAPQIADALEPLRPYITGGGTSSDQLRDGINKELVEGNSSLIASYINAMRADLSVIRAQDTAGWKDVNAIAVVLPTLGDHLARIAAADENTARNTGEILSKLKSVITASSAGGSAVRTTK